MKKKSPPKKNSSSAIDVALDVASFVPGPTGMTASAIGAVKNVYEGDYKGALLDGANIVTGGTSKYLKAASSIAKASNASKVASKTAKKANVLAKASNPNIYKTAGLVRDARGVSLQNTSLMRSPQRESTYVASRINPYSIPKKK